MSWFINRKLWLFTGGKGGIAQPKLICQNPRFNLFDSTIFKVAKLERAIGHADQAANLVTKMFHDPSYLAIFTFADNHGQPGVAWHLPVQTRINLPITYAVNRHPVCKIGQRQLVNMSLNPDPVFTAPSS